MLPTEHNKSFTVPCLFFDSVVCRRGILCEKFMAVSKTKSVVIIVGLVDGNPVST